MRASTELYTIQELARYLRVTTRSVYRYIHTGQLKATKLTHGVWQIRDEAIEAFLARDAGQALQVSSGHRTGV